EGVEVGFAVGDQAEVSVHAAEAINDPGGEVQDGGRGGGELTSVGAMDVVVDDRLVHTPVAPADAADVHGQLVLAEKSLIALVSTSRDARRRRGGEASAEADVSIPESHRSLLTQTNSHCRSRGEQRDNQAPRNPRHASRTRGLAAPVDGMYKYKASRATKREPSPSVGLTRCRTAGVEGFIHFQFRLCEGQTRSSSRERGFVDYARGPERHGSWAGGGVRR